MGPSDTLNPLGPPLPPGTYRFEVVARGVYFEDGVEVSFETRGALEFELLP